MTVSAEPFGSPDGRTPATLYTIENENGMRLAVTDYGARVVRLYAPDRAGRTADVALGLADAGAYARDNAYLGATCGRISGRIAGGAFTLDGTRYELIRNDGANTLHGGARGLSHMLWHAEPIGNGVRFAVRSPDGDQGFPGTLDVAAVYTLTPDNAVRIVYEAKTDRDTPVSLTNHTYFNLGGHASGSVMAHTLRMAARTYFPAAKDLLPLDAADTAGTDFDFSAPRAFGEQSYDHCFALDAGVSEAPAFAAVLTDPRSGRRMEVYTTLPGLVLYTSNMLSPRPGKDGVAYGPHCAVCLETQFYPDAVNHPAYPSPLLRAGGCWRHETQYRFSCV